jgi:hypothetical protein
MPFIRGPEVIIGHSALEKIMKWVDYICSIKSYDHSSGIGNIRREPSLKANGRYGPAENPVGLAVLRRKFGIPVTR